MIPQWIVNIAIICHQANKAWCERNGDFSQKDWANAPDWQKDSAVNGVVFHVRNPDANDSASHDNWMKEKVEAGWVYGEKKNEDKKTHPCIRPFNELPEVQQKKDKLFRAIVHALKEAEGI